MNTDVVKKDKIRDLFYKYLEDPHGNRDDFLAMLEKQRQQWLQYRQSDHDMRWRQNASFYAGNHYIRDTGRNANQYRVKLRENHTNNVIQRMVSLFVQNMPIVRVFPASSSLQDKNDAQACESYVKYAWRMHKMEQKIIKQLRYSCIFGNGFMFRSFDPYAGGELYLDPTESKSGNGEIKKYRGDIKLDVDDPFRIVPRPGIEELDDMYDIYRCVPSNKAELESQYGEIESIPVTSLNAYSGLLRTDDDLTMVNHYYHKPTHWFPEGMYVCYAGKKILKAQTYPYRDGKLPINHLPFDKPPMKFWASSTIDQIIDLQEQLNRAASQIVEARNLVARPRVLVSQEAEVPGQSITDRPGDIIRFKLSGGPPKFEVPQFNFTELANHKADVRNALQLVSGMTSASRGEIPAATRTALALQLVLEQDRSQWSPFVRQFYDCIQDTVVGILGIAAQFFPEEDPRIVKINQNNSTGTVTFHGGMVPSPLDIWLEDTNKLGWTAAGRIEAIQSLVQVGLIKDENKALEMLEISNDSPAYRLNSISREAAQKENELMLKGEALDVMPEDIDPIHLDEHLKEVCSFEFRKRPKIVQQLILDHIEQHKQRMAPPPQGGPQVGSGEAAAKGIQEVARTVAPVPPGGNMEQLLGGAGG
jgi:hypothetical protein